MKAYHQALYAFIKKHGTVKQTEVHNFVASLGGFTRTADRRLRPSEAPFIQTLYDEKSPRRPVIGYKWKAIKSGDYEKEKS